ncbi:MAG: DUF6095 family protein [Bacteroidetes bacterium]|jgi:hypothetical protein|nr:DUF6095 family protein [Bacteroidota bacterium]MDA1019374.1 DUF6095 family protein [Bacteroidota bacterium]|tara:strand:- start:14006 stop:14242 length:237 start_codon:yes stop_codon:yes gene_type:complete
MKKNHLAEGLKKIFISIFLMFLGPTILFQSFKNEDHPWFLPVLSVSIVVCVLSLFYGVKGLQSIMNAIFKKKDTKVVK